MKFLAGSTRHLPPTICHSLFAIGWSLNLAWARETRTGSNQEP